MQFTDCGLESATLQLSTVEELSVIVSIRIAAFCSGAHLRSSILHYNVVSFYNNLL